MRFFNSKHRKVRVRLTKQKVRALFVLTKCFENSILFVARLYLIFMAYISKHYLFTA